MSDFSALIRKLLTLFQFHADFGLNEAKTVCHTDGEISAKILLLVKATVYHVLLAIHKFKTKQLHSKPINLCRL